MTEVNPYIAYRRHLDAYHHAIAAGVSDDQYVDLVTRLDAEVAEVWGHGFVQTPLIDLNLDTDVDLNLCASSGNDADSGDRSVSDPGDTGQGPDQNRIGRVLAKVETGNVSGSHKARHLFGLLIYRAIEQVQAEGADSQPGTTPRPFVIASCGNAALAAAVVAGATGQELQVFVPDSADPVVLGQLKRYGAHVNVCHRQDGAEGDPCVAAMTERIEAGDRPFTVQGPICPQSIDGARTIGLEIATQLETTGVWPDHVWIQIGGGALATATLDGLARATQHPAPARPDPARRLPRLHPVQATAAHPYVAGWRRIAHALSASMGLGHEGTEAEQADRLAQAFEHRANRLRGPLEAVIDAALDQVQHLMTTWPHEPHSVASGILDDLTYDWRTVMRHQIITAGWPVTVDEPLFVRAAEQAARHVSPPPDETGAAGLAGLLQDPVGGPEAVHLVILTGVRRSLASE